MTVEHGDTPPYVHRLSSGVERSDEPVTLDADTEEEVTQRLNDIAEARAEAAVSGRDYIIR